jgi:anti-sigma regulatory factor (Ser/Thr protein kinase)
LDQLVTISLTDPSQVGEARRAALSLADLLDFDETDRAKVALVITEATTNVIKHAGEGQVLLRPLDASGRQGIEVLVLDRGPGIADVRRCLQDGFSTFGTPGNGLGAIFRQSAYADLHSSTGAGTALLARLWNGPAPWPDNLQVGAVSVPKSGEEVCGDAWAVARDGERTLFLVADGLGHGPLAADASREAVHAFRQNRTCGPVAILQAAHQSLRGTRGAAVAVAEVDASHGIVRFAGVGNIAGAVVDGSASRSMVSYNGTVGVEARKFQEFTYPFPRGALLVMHSDGLGSRWDLGAYPGLVCRDPSLVMGVLYRDFQRGRDDVTVLVARMTEDAQP